MKNFWDKLQKPFFCLAPMADVTDAAFRRIICKYGKPDVFWTEFVSADGLVSEGRKILKNNLIFSKKEKPIIAQLFSANPIKMHQAVRYVASLGFDGIDINMGCPDKSIEKQGAGAAMIKDMKKAGEIIQAVKDGIKNSGKKVSISVKTRIGYNKNQINEWIPFLLKQDIDALIIHARTRKEMSKVPARWEHVKEVVNIRNRMRVKTKIIGNGDVKDLKEGKKLAKETGCDGIMIGRAIFGNPWLFSRSEKSHSVKQKLKVMLEHTKLFEKILGKHKNFAVMKKHFKAYVNGFDGAKELRVKLMKTNSSKEVKKTVKEFLSKRQTKEVRLP
ncbi:MAG: tRNA-dihydrouridine synthase [Candidatus Paceibacterota bacterium]